MSDRLQPRDDGGLVLALILAALAGWVDAAGLAGSGGVFISFMSGNTTDLAVSLAHQDWIMAGTIGMIVGLFVVGVMTGELLQAKVERSLVLGLEALFLATGAALYSGLFGVSDQAALCPLVFAMGLQNATMHRAGGISIGLTYVTGTLVQIGRAVASILRGDRAVRRLLEYAALWCSLATGAGLGALTVAISAMAALAASSLVALALAVTSALLSARQRYLAAPPQV